MGLRAEVAKKHENMRPTSSTGCAGCAVEGHLPRASNGSPGKEINLIPGSHEKHIPGHY